MTVGWQEQKAFRTNYLANGVGAIVREQEEGIPSGRPVRGDDGADWLPTSWTPGAFVNYRAVRGGEVVGTGTCKPAEWAERARNA
jgi:hypothetical protein